MVIPSLNAALWWQREELQFAAELVPEVSQVMGVQGVRQDQVGGERSSQDESVQGQGRQQPQHYPQLHTHRVAEVGEEALGSGRL